MSVYKIKIEVAYTEVCKESMRKLRNCSMTNCFWFFYVISARHVDFMKVFTYIDFLTG